MEDRKAYNLSERDFIKWVEKEVERDMKTLTEEEKKDFQKALKLGELLAQNKHPDPSICKEWEDLLKKMRAQKQKSKSKRKTITNQITV